MSGSRRGLLILAALLSAGAASCGGGKEEAVRAGAGAERVLSSSDVRPAARGDVEDGIRLTGSLDPHRSVQVRAQLSGTVVEAPVLAGEPVRGGQLLVRYDDRTFEERLSAARSAVAAARAAVATAEHDERGAEVLAEAGAISEHDLRLARSAAEAARAQLEAARAERGLAREALSRTVVRSPTDGIVNRKLVTAGEAVNPGQPLYSVVDLDTLELEAKVPVHHLSSVTPGGPVVFELDAYPGRRFEGEVARVEPLADAATRQITVYVRLPNPDRALVGGLYATGLIVRERVRDVTTLPADAVRGQADGAYVLAIEDGVVRRKSVTLGPRDAWSDRVAIRSDLPPGISVVVGPEGDLVAGIPVRVQPARMPLAAGVEGGR